MNWAQVSRQSPSQYDMRERDVGQRTVKSHTAVPVPDSGRLLQSAQASFMLTQAKVIWEEGTSIEKMPPTILACGQGCSTGCFGYCWLVGWFF